ncbi:hypothetical protein ACFQJ5_12020 [Halomicroarcula sp. GCM10025324]|jgi:hypothetical protein|uniref:DUF7522 family protein n=1 Tax=Haloarcula TaxID=2237 RepID=UPI0023E7D354|nr:hypothetical protein [Halomicroarcula sp. ZS-22-S1]
MYSVPFSTGIDTPFADSVVSAARTTLGDSLRSVIYFGEHEMDLLYVRKDLYETEQGAMEVKSRLVEFERIGFDEAPIRSVLSVPNDPSSIGTYEFTVRIHDDGYVIRILGDSVGVLLTTDEMDVEAFEDAAEAITRLLKDPVG